MNFNGIKTRVFLIVLVCVFIYASFSTYASTTDDVSAGDLSVNDIVVSVEAIKEELVTVSGNIITSEETVSSNDGAVTFDVSGDDGAFNEENDIATEELSVNDVSGSDVSFGDVSDNAVPDVSGNGDVLGTTHQNATTDVSVGDLIVEDISGNDCALKTAQPALFSTMNVASTLVYTDTDVEYYAEDAAYTFDISNTEYDSVFIYIFSDGTTVFYGEGAMTELTETTLSEVSSLITRVVVSEDSAIKASESFYGVFINCTNLVSADLNALDMSDVRSISNLFEGCINLVEVHVNEWNTASLEHISGTFTDCTSLESIDVNGWNTENVKTANGTFQRCTSLTELYLNDWITTNITSAVYMFAECTNLHTLYVDNWNMSNLTVANNMFYKCESLTNLDLSGWNAINLKVIKHMFRNCLSLVSLNLSGWDVSNVEDLSGVFYLCKALTELDLTGWNPSNAVIMYETFSYCRSLQSLEISEWDTSNVVTMQELFYYCNALTNFNVSNWDVSNVTNASGMFYKCSSLVRLDLSNWITSSMEDISGMFYYCSSLKELIAPNLVTSATESISNLCYRCEALEILDISNWNTKNVTDFSNSFYYCGSLTVLDVSNWNVENAENMSGTFYRCENIEVLDVSRWIATKVKNLERAFYNCKKISVLDLSGFCTNEETNTVEMAYKCGNLTDIVLGENVAVLDNTAFKASDWIVTTVTDNSSNVALSLDWESMNRIGDMQLADSIYKIYGSVWDLDSEVQSNYLSLLTEDATFSLQHCYPLSLKITKTEQEPLIHEALMGYVPLISVKLDAVLTVGHSEQDLNLSNTAYYFSVKKCACREAGPFYDCQYVLLRSLGDEYELVEDIEQDCTMTISCTSELADTDNSLVYTVAYILKPKYSVSVPIEIDLDNEGNGTFSVSANGSYEVGNVNILPASTFILRQYGKNDVEATINQSQHSFKSGEGSWGTISAPAISAGIWSGTFDFSISTTYDDLEWEEYLSEKCNNY